MPKIIVHGPAGTFDPAQRQGVAAELTDFAIECEALPASPFVRSTVWTYFNEYAPDTVYTGASPVALSTTAVEAFLSEKDDTAIVMLNLIRFEPDGGRARYMEYMDMAKPILARFGAKVRFGGDGLAPLTEGPAQGWDAVVLVQYPNRAAFKNMVADPQYQIAFKVGVSAIADIVLQPLKAIDGLA